MSYALKQSQTARPLLFLMVDESDHVSPKAGLSPTVTLSKNGGSFASPAGAVSEVGSGWYKVAGNATDTGTLGPLVLHATASGADPTDILFEVVSYNPEDAVRLGLTALPNAAADAAGGLPISDAGGLDLDARLDAAISSRASQTSVDTIDGIVDAILVDTGTTLDGKVDAIQERTGNLPDDPADESDLEAYVAAAVAPLSTHSAADVASAILLNPSNKFNTDSSGAAVVRSHDSGLIRAATAQGGGASSITLDSGASSTTNLYRGLRVRIRTNTGADQVRVITAYDGGTKVATVNRAWVTAPDNTSTFCLYSDDQAAQSELPTAAAIADAVLDEASAEHLTSGTIGAKIAAASAAGDPWETDLPGEYGEGSAGSIIGALSSGAGATPAEIWAFGQRTLTSPAATSAQVAAGTLVARRADTLAAELTGVGSLAERTALYFALKSSPGDEDSEALLLIEETAGLLVALGAPADGEDGAPADTDASLTVTDAETGAVEISAQAAVMRGLTPGTSYYYALKAINGEDAVTVAEGRFTISRAIVHAVS